VNAHVDVNDFAERYAHAWSNHDPQKVAAFFAENGSLSVNDSPAAIGRTAIAEIARGFMRDFPDLVVIFDKMAAPPAAGKSGSCDAVFHWTLIGTNTGAGGTGNAVRISGYEMWKFDDAGLVLESKGYFDAADYQRQLAR
jgi:hypothetical protein